MRTLKVTDEMKRILERDKAHKERGLIVPGEPVIFSDYFIKAIESISKAELDKMDFYYYAYRPEQIEGLPGINIEFDYFGKARTIQEIKGWNEIIPAISNINCGGYLIYYVGSNFYTMEGGHKVRIRYGIKELPQEPVKKVEEIKPVIQKGEKKGGK